MIKTSLAVVLLTAAQNALSLELQLKSHAIERPVRIDRVELRQLVVEELETGDYDIGNGEDQCVRRHLLRVLREYFRREYRCNHRFDDEGMNPNPFWLEKCHEKNDMRKAQRLDYCMIDDVEASSATTAEEQASSEDSEEESTGEVEQTIEEQESADEEETNEPEESAPEEIE